LLRDCTSQNSSEKESLIFQLLGQHKENKKLLKEFFYRPIEK
jgi:hypothetical protein